MGSPVQARTATMSRPGSRTSSLDCLKSKAMLCPDYSWSLPAVVVAEGNLALHSSTGPNHRVRILHVHCVGNGASRANSPRIQGDCGSIRPRSIGACRASGYFFRVGLARPCPKAAATPVPGRLGLTLVIEKRSRARLATRRSRGGREVVRGARLPGPVLCRLGGSRPRDGEHRHRRPAGRTRDRMHDRCVPVARALDVEVEFTRAAQNALRNFRARLFRGVAASGKSPVPVRVCTNEPLGTGYACRDVVAGGTTARPRIRRHAVAPAGGSGRQENPAGFLRTGPRPTAPSEEHPRCKPVGCGQASSAP